MARKFQIGQRVRCTSDYVFPNGEPALGKLGRVYKYVGGSQNHLMVEFSDSKYRDFVHEYFGTLDRPHNDFGHWHEYHWEKYQDLLDHSRPVSLRDGGLIQVERTSDPDRPFAAVVKGRRLTFDPEGFFYPGIEQPIDLVNS